MNLQELKDDLASVKKQLKIAQADGDRAMAETMENAIEELNTLIKKAGGGGSNPKSGSNRNPKPITKNTGKKTARAGRTKAAKSRSRNISKAAKTGKAVRPQKIKTTKEDKAKTTAKAKEKAADDKAYSAAQKAKYGLLKKEAKKPRARLADDADDIDIDGERVSGEAEIIKKAISLHDSCEKGVLMTPKKWQSFYYMIVRHIKAKKVRKTGEMAQDILTLQKIALECIDDPTATKFAIENNKGKLDKYRDFVAFYNPKVKIPAKYREAVPLSGTRKKPLSKAAFKRRMAEGKANAAAARESGRPAKKR